MKIYRLKKYTKEDELSLRKLIKKMGWSTPQINGQIEKLKELLKTKNSIVFVCKDNNKAIGFIQSEIYHWNNLVQIHGLVVDPEYRRLGIAKKLIENTEKVVINKKIRGIYVDTPVNNIVAKKFYQSMGYKKDYIMSEYYDKGVDGVTYLKLIK